MLKETPIAPRYRGVEGDRRPPLQNGLFVRPPVQPQAGHPQHRVRDPPVRPARQGDRAGLGGGPDHRDRHRPRASPAPAQPTGKGSSTWSPRSPWAGPGSCSAWNAPGWPATFAGWHQLLELCGMTGTVICDEDGLYDPRNFNDRLLLGMKGQLSEALCRIPDNISPGYTVNRSGSGSCISVVRQGRFAAGRSRLGGWPLPCVAGGLPRGFLLVRMSAYRIGSCPAASSITR